MKRNDTKPITRRGLLKGALAASAALAAPQFVPSTVMGRNGAVPPSEKILVGGIGVGGRGSGDVNWMMGEPDIQFMAVCDVRKARRDAVKNQIDKKYGNKDCKTYGDIREFLAERTDIDAVLIATGDRWHALASVLAMRAGKDVYCEKPACLTIAQGKVVVETAKRYGRVYQTGAQRLSEPNHVFAIEMAKSGRLGKIHTAYADCRWRGGSRRDWLPEQPLPPKEEVDWDIWLGPTPWRPFNAQYLGGGGGWYNFYDLATDLAMWGAHTVAQALAGIDMTNVTTIDFEFDKPDATINTKLSNGVKLVLYRCPGSVWQRCEFWWSSCGERFDGPDGWAGAADGYSRPDVSHPSLLQEFRKVVGDYAARTGRPNTHVRDFFNCIRSRRQAVANPEVMLKSMSICLAADVVEQLKRNLKFDLVKYEFIDAPEANRMLCRSMREPWCM